MVYKKVFWKSPPAFELPFFFLLAVPSPPVLAPEVQPPNLFAIIALRAASKVASMFFIKFFQPKSPYMSESC